MNRIFSSLALLAVSGAAMGCAEETLSSEDIRTAGIAALIEVKAENESSSRVRVELLAGGSSSNTKVVLDNGDKLTATVDGETKTLTTQDTGVYTANFSTGAADAEFVIAFERRQDENAPNSIGTLPPPFVIAPIDLKSRANDAVEINWDPAGSDSIVIKVDGDCLKSVSDIKTSDTGSYTIPAGTLGTFESDADKTCDVTVQIWRNRGGSADKAFDVESRYVASQVRAVKFQSAP